MRLHGAIFKHMDINNNNLNTRTGGVSNNDRCTAEPHNDASYAGSARTVNADAAHGADAHSARRSAARAPRRREMPLSGTDMAHISESLEESVSAYEYDVRAHGAQTAAPTQAQSYPAAHTLAAESVKTPQEACPSYAGFARQATAPVQQIDTVHARQSYSADPDSEHYEAELGNMEALRAARAKRAAHGSGQQASDDAQRLHSADSGAYAANTDAEQYDDAPRKKKRPVLQLLLLLLLLGTGFIGYKFITGQSGYYTVAVFGVDSRNGNVGKEALSDVNIIARIDRASGEIKLVSLYRDTYTQIDSEGTYHKLNEAYFRGGAEQAVWAVEHNTDVDIDDYATFNWKAVADAINILGGIDLEISDAEFKYINAFITETVNSTGIGSYQLEHAGMNHLDGVQSVAYARLRLMDTDFQRTARQRKVIALALDKAKAADYGTLLNILTTVMPQISASVTPDDLVPFMHGVSKYYISDTAGFPFDKATADIGRLDCVVPVTLESNAIKLHEFLYPGTLYTPSAGLKRISDRIINDTGLSG